jgi:fructosamine-3-kinase
MDWLPAVSAAIGAATDSSFSPGPPIAATGGSINQAYILADGERRYFVKTNAASSLPMFEAEADGLRALAAVAALRVPDIITFGANEAYSFLVLEYLDLQPLREREEAIAFGRALADLHHSCGERHGWHRSNFIGRTPQLNTPHAAWPYFFAHRRLLPQLRLARERGLPAKLAREGEKLADKAGAFFVGYIPSASLLHGDLWCGNAAMGPEGAPVAFDPAVYHGDREADLAMTELFGGFPEAFYAAYREAWPLADGHSQRKNLYNLYHVLNHLNLFGNAYLRQAERMITSLLAEVRA